MVTDDFTRSDSSSLGSNWTAVTADGIITGGLRVASDQVAGISGTTGSASFWSADSFGGDQYSEITTVTGSVFSDVGAGAFIGPTVRMDAGGNGYVGIYFYNSGSPVLQIYRAAGGSLTKLGADFALGGAGNLLAAGVKLRLSAVGNTITFSQDGTPRVSVTDGTYTGGAPGIIAFNAALADGWSADNVTVPPPSGPSDNFNRSDSSSLGANWTPLDAGGIVAAGGLSVASDQVAGASGTNALANIWTADEFEDDQYSEITTVTNSIGPGAGGAGEFIGPTVRMDSSGNGYVGIYFYNASGGFAHPVLAVYRSDGGTLTQLGSNFALSDLLPAGVKLRLTVVGDSITFSQDGVDQITVTDSDYASGAPGILAFDAALADNWSSGGAVTPPNAFTATLTGTDVNGVKTYSVTSDDNGPDANNMRVLPPSSPPSGVAHAFLLVLPTEAGNDEPGDDLGDGLEVLRGLNAHNNYNLTLVNPQFNIQPWYADCDDNDDYQFETFMVSDLVPWILDNLGTGDEHVYLIGFSKSGLGATFLLLKHPSVFAAAAAWDFPANQDAAATDHGRTVGDGINFGSDANFETNYELSSAHITTWISGKNFTTVNRLWIGSYGAFQDDMSDFDTLLTGLDVLHTTETPTERTHAWNSGWVPDALVGLFGEPPTPSGMAPVDLPVTAQMDAVGLTAAMDPVGLTAEMDPHETGAVLDA
jgi:putative esterase